MMSLSSHPLPNSTPVNLLPGSFTKEKLHKLLQRAKFLESQGATADNNAELAQILGILKNLQSLQQRSNAATVSKHPMGNGTNSAPLPPLSQDQIAALKHQITAFKLISKNMPLPPKLLQAVLSSPKGDKNIIINNNNKALSNAERIDNHNETIPQSSIDSILSEKTPVDDDFVKQIINSRSHTNSHSLTSIPAMTRMAVDPHMIITERERRMQARIQYRIAELEKLPSNLSNATQDRILFLEEEIASSSSPNLKLKAILELKGLRLLSKQKKLREEIVNGLTRSTTLATSADRLAYRRMKKQSLREARMTEKIERQQRIEREQREKQKHLNYLQTICDHGRSLVTFQKTWQQKQAKLGRAVQQFHQHIEKEEQKKTERISKERIRALKNDDEEAYMKLIDEAKDTRLTQLLRQTGMFLESLTKAVVDQQNDPVHAADLHARAVDEELGDESDATKTDYFQMTHRVKEEVSQPSILVGGKLKDYQLKGLQWMVSLYNNHLNGILADEMGLGKTIQTISLITYLIEKKRQNGPYLIIVPLSTLTNWTLEFEKWAPSVAKIVYKGPPQVRKNLQMDIRYGDFQVLLTTFEYIIKDRPILSKIKWLHMIVDEGHRMKNTNSKLTLVLRQYYHTRYRLILTGTPLQNNLPELWALLNFILPKIFKSVKSFEEWFNTPFSNQGVQDKIDLNEEEQLLIIKRLHKVLRPFLLRRLKKDVESELPDKVERVIKCKLSSLQAKLYAQMKKHGMLFTAGGEKGKMGIKGLNNTIMQLRKICNHPFVYEEVENAVNPGRLSNELLYRVSGKFELLDRMLPKLKQTGHRVLIFFQMTQIMSIMEDFLNYRGFHYLRLDGSTKADDRSQLLQVFNAPDSPYFVFLLSTRAGGLGLNLQSADTVVIFDSDWNPHQDLQAQDRAHRIGQTKEVRIFRLISSNSVEENILARANYKLDIDGKVIQAGKFDNRSTEEDREAFLRSLLEDKSGDMDEGDDEELDDEELNEMLKRSDEELTVFQKLDAAREREDLELWRRKGGRGRKVERLVQEHELPDIYRQEENADEEEGPLLEYGRGQRVKGSIRYDDGLTEEQWVNALEDDDVDLDELIARKEARRRRRLEKLANAREEDTSSDTGSRRGRRRRDTSAAPENETPVLPKKRGRPPKKSVAVVEVRKRARKVKKNQLLGPDTVPASLREKMTHLFMACYKAVEECTEEEEDEEEDSYRRRSELFMDLVSKRDYPMYYTMIERPISMKMIKERIHSPYYKSVADFRADFYLMFDNARTFNEEGSVVYEDANELQKMLDAKLEALCPGGVIGSAAEPTSMVAQGEPQENSRTGKEEEEKRSSDPKTAEEEQEEDEEEDYEEEDEEEED
ncbi:hypothetical protein EC973_009458 [Apophysomyces ossiformis]|uniref:Uncharacterized protein n=1 Tax=Apophysomyces ossiformis TaxID=679940 RepID=A0A8H7BLX8_9FUNG|nr:hypothetical protein EC973_009458 [Apophysomyces ossiformis]